MKHYPYLLHMEFPTFINANNKILKIVSVKNCIIIVLRHNVLT